MNIALVDDHQLVRDGFKHLIETQADLNVVIEANDYHQAVELLSKLTVDLAIIDVSLPDVNGIELVRYCNEHYPDMKTLIVSMYDQPHYVNKALDAGANGYVSKRSASDLLLNAIVAVSSGDSYLSQDVLNKLTQNKGVESPLQLSLLTEREQQILPLLAKGINAKKIAQLLDIMPKTAHTHRINIYKKLNVCNSFELLKISLNSGIIALEELS